MLIPRRLTATASSSPEGILGRLMRAFPARSLADADAEAAVSAAVAVRPSAPLASRAVAPVTRSWFERLDHWFWRMEQREREDYLAGAGDITELEARMRALEARRSRAGYPF